MAPEPLLDSPELFAFAHDLRTHLRTVLTRVQLVQRSSGALLPAEDQALLKEAVTAAGEIHGLVNAVMAYSEAGGESEGQMKLSLVIRGALMDRKPLLTTAEADVEVVNDLQIGVPRELQGVLSEVLTNSCKFRNTFSKLCIRIATRMLGQDLVEIEVRDNGNGVPVDYLEKIFVPFQRLHGRDEFPGHGLGLATARRVLRGWGGSIEAAAEDSQGLTIRIRVPVTLG